MEKKFDFCIFNNFLVISLCASRKKYKYTKLHFFQVYSFLYTLFRRRFEVQRPEPIFGMAKPISLAFQYIFSSKSPQKVTHQGMRIIKTYNIRRRSSMHVMTGVVQQLTHNRGATKSVAWYVIYSTVFAIFDWQSITSITRDDSATILRKCIHVYARARMRMYWICLEIFFVSKL